MASIMGRLEVLSSRKIEVKADALAEDMDYESADMLFLPGGRKGSENLLNSELVKKWCVEFAKAKKLAAICAAPSVLARFGLLEESHLPSRLRRQDDRCIGDRNKRSGRRQHLYRARPGSDV